MNTVVETEKDFKPVLIEVNHKNVEKQVEGASDIAKKITAGFIVVENFFDKKLSDDELREVATRGIAFVDEELEKDFQFPKASKEFNLEAAGIKESYEAVQKSLMNYTSGIVAYDFDIVGGEAKLSEKGKLRIMEANSVYTRNEMQNKLLKKFEKVVKELNYFCNIGLINRFDTGQIEQAFKFVKHGYASDGNSPKYKVNANYLRDITVEGKYHPIW